MSRSSLLFSAAIPMLLLACSAASTEPGSRQSDSLSKAPAGSTPPVPHPIETSPSTPTPPEGASCGPVTCAAGEVCCNDSCGICTAAGGACPQLACQPAAPPSQSEPPPCVKTGCNGDVCADQQIVTTCLWNPAAACYADATCERQADGRCGFTETPELTKCVADAND